MTQEASTQGLSIETILPALRSALEASVNVVLQAPPGAGKTTRVPIALRDVEWLAGRKIVMLEPRRVAARAAASFMARSLGEQAGATVGYRTRLDTRVSPSTRVEVVTEGILARMLAGDPGLDDYGLVIFDEFHERNLHADLGLALALESQALLRPDLRILVMSATLDGERVAALLDDAPVITAEGRTFPIEVRYRPPRPDSRLETRVAGTIGDALVETEGDVLVFLPGAAEIRRVGEALAGTTAHRTDVIVLPMHGMLEAGQQDQVLLPDRAGRRKVILATSIAETSLTIDGVRVVVDAGLSRTPRFSARTGMTRLETVRASRASTEQRAGRAGRQAPGICYRLWSEAEQAGLAPFHDPEIAAADLVPLVLTVLAAGADLDTMRWLDAPPRAHVAQARALLTEFAALGAKGRITPHGRELAALGLHPRLGQMIAAARSLGSAALAMDLAALVEERDILRSDAGPVDPDLRIRVDLLQQRGVPPFANGARVMRDALDRIRTHARALRRQAGVREGSPGSGDTGLLLAFAYPERIAQRRPGTSRFLLRNGRGAALAVPHALPDAEFIVAVDLDDKGAEGRIFLAAPVSRADLEEHLGGHMVTDEVVRWNAESARVDSLRVRRLGAIVLSEGVLRDPAPELVAAAFADGVARTGVAALPWRDDFANLRARIAFLRRIDDTWPDLSDEALPSRLARWLATREVPRKLADLERVDFAALLLADLTWEQRQRLEVEAPTHIEVPSGSRLPIDYASAASPVLAVRLQEMFGLADTPRIARGRVPLTLHLLSPAHRPVQVTSDLGGFWRSSYQDVRKDLRGRYPKHPWPEDPLTAPPTRRAKPRR